MESEDLEETSEMVLLYKATSLLGDTLLFSLSVGGPL